MSYHGYDWPSVAEWEACTYAEKVERATELLRQAAGNEHPRHGNGGTPSIAVRQALHLVEEAIEEGPDEQ